MEQRDDLTQLLSRGSFDAELPESVADALRQSRPLSVILGDVDHFKKVNDTHGHQAGDSVLREISARLEAVAYGKGKAFRYGGEEIAVILRNYSLNEALAVAERSRRAIEERPINGIIVTMSIGVSCLPDHAPDAESLLRAADRALYDAKDRDRNLVRFFGEPPPQAGPRKSNRKAPEPGRLTEQQCVALRKRLLRDQAIECPLDGAFLDVHDITSFDSIGKEFLVVCPDCGLSAELRGG